ncbi:hypothetical protein [Paraburkholderia sp. BL10I2N1]|uniref:hypothetical protein n=1 Tax=Paraburkholderia sp. BL10I2N1 TaxID=1938796 RepID=UPI001414D65C|nr:hypothetical protein [Paraburkholderia sp. BL10I2N1]
MSIYLATGIANSAPLAMLWGQRCMTLLWRNWNHKSAGNNGCTDSYLHGKRLD